MTQLLRPRILVTVPLDEAAIQHLEQVSVVDFQPDLSTDELHSLLPRYHAIVIDSDAFLPGNLLEAAPDLRVIVIAGVLHSGINVQSAEELGISVLDVQAPHTVALAEKTFSEMLSMAHHARVGLAGKTLGLVGVGAIGQEVAQRAQAFGMHVLANQPGLSAAAARDLGVEPTELHTLLQNSDFISLHVRTTNTREFALDDAQLAHCKTGAFLINTGSHGVIDVPALQRALRKGQLTAATLLIPNSLDGTIETSEDLTVLPQNTYAQAQIGRDASLRLAEQLADEIQGLHSGNSLGLRVVQTQQIFPHEHFDAKRVKRLAVKLESASMLMNPPIVSEWKGNYVVLDGATRTNAFRQMGFPSVAVQVVPHDHPKLNLDTWYHAVQGLSAKMLVKALDKQSDLVFTKTNPENLEADIRAGKVMSGVITNEKTAYAIQPADGIPAFQALNTLVAKYTDLGFVARTLNTNIDALQQEFPDFAALFLFAPFPIPDVLQAALDGNLYPAGITRFIIPQRILRLNAPLDILGDEDIPLNRKNIWLDQFLAERAAAERVRLYQEPVVLLDE